MIVRRFGTLSLIALMMFSTVGVFARPQMPHQFYGAVTIDGVAAADGIAVEARIGGVAFASSTTSSGLYGWSPVFQVTADDPDTGLVEGGVNGETVTFYVGGRLATSYTFLSGGVAEVNLAISTAVVLQEIPLFEGWNLIVIPTIPEDPSIENVLSDIISYVESVWAFDGETKTWSSYSPGAPSSLTEMVGDTGYWIKVAERATLTVHVQDISGGSGDSSTVNELVDDINSIFDELSGLSLAITAIENSLSQITSINNRLSNSENALASLEDDYTSLQSNLASISSSLNQNIQSVEEVQAYSIFRRTLANPGTYIANDISSSIFSEIQSSNNLIGEWVGVVGSSIVRTALSSVINSQLPTLVWNEYDISWASTSQYNTYLETSFPLILDTGLPLLGEITVAKINLVMHGLVNVDRGLIYSSTIIYIGT